jgi:predicted dehydrogenase
MSNRLRAGVIGLGQIGWRFDEEVGRRSVWTHVGAYKALPTEFDLIGACDPSARARDEFAFRHPEVPIFAEIAAMIAETAPHVVSICTPNAAHRMTLEAVLAAGRPQAVWCEKPLAVSLADADAVVNACQRAKTILVVSHVRRWSPLWQRFKWLIENESLGTLRCLRIAMPNRLWSIGSHAVDLLLWLGGPVGNLTAMAIPNLEEDGEPAVGALLNFESGAAGILQVTGGKSDLIVEAEAIGDDARMMLREDTGVITLEKFSRSLRYSGYRELRASEVENMPQDETFSPFIAIAQELARLSTNANATPTCSGRDALMTQNLLEKIIALATQPATRMRGFA